MDKLETIIRFSIKEDLPFIYDSWIKSAKHIYPNQFALDFDKHFLFYIKEVLKTSIITVCHPKEDKQEILSYLVYRGFQDLLIVNFGYTKSDARKQGYFSSLLSLANPDNYTTIFTFPAKNETIMKHFSSKFIFDPTAINLKQVSNDNILY